MTKPVTTLRQLISYLRAIPAKKWRTGGRLPDKEGRCCAMGWVEQLFPIQNVTRDANEFVKSLGIYADQIETTNDAGWCLITPEVNDFSQCSRSPKVRVLTYLKSKLSQTVSQ